MALLLRGNVHFRMLVFDETGRLFYIVWNDCNEANTSARNLMESNERKAYIKAVQCIMSLRSKSDPAKVPGARVRQANMWSAPKATTDFVPEPLRRFRCTAYQPDIVDSWNWQLSELAQIFRTRIRESIARRMWIQSW
jgi:hypothetical protein